MRWWPAAVLAVAAGAAAVALAAPHRATAPPAAATATITVAPDARGIVVPRGFLGLSVEWDSVAAYAGSPARARALARLLVPLGPLALRIGGDTQDQAWWNPDRRPRPAGVLQDIGPATLGAVGRLASATRGPVTLGLDLALRDPANALALARRAQARLPHGALAVAEIGNEPDLYTHARTVRVPGHVHRRLRKRARYGPAAYGRDAAPYLRVLRAGLGPRPALAVAGFAGGAWWPALPGLLRAWGGRAGALQAHLYALPGCSRPTPPASWLLTTAASRGRVATLAPLATIAHRARLPWRVAELNSAACGGRPRFSETPAAAAWLTDTLFAILRAGAAGADVHTWDHARYALFAPAGAGMRTRAPFAGLLAFARAAPPGSALARTRVGGGDGAVRAWATTGPDGATRVALIARSGARVRVRVRRGTGCALLLTAARRTRVCPRAGAYRLALATGSLAVLVVR
ncbi:MAG: hypothetical protein ACXVSX_10680 [Solirubrobacteraceae bacterium]